MHPQLALINRHKNQNHHRHRNEDIQLSSSNNNFASTPIMSNDNYFNKNPTAPMTTATTSDKVVHQYEHQQREKRDIPFLQFQTKNDEKNADYWMNSAQKILQNQLNKNKLNKNVAKNIILFLGDGMSIPTLAATRIYLGGEENVLSFEEFPYSGLSKVILFSSLMNIYYNRNFN